MSVIAALRGFGKQDTLGSSLAYKAQFLKLWSGWEASLPEGERAPNFLQKERFLTGLSLLLQDKIRGKFLENFEEDRQWAKLKDCKLQFQANLARREHQPLINEQPLPPQPVIPNIFEDLHIELL